MRLVTAIAAVALVAVACTAPGSDGTPQASDVASAAPSTVIEQPPAAFLAAEGQPVEGFLGTYCWNGTCADMFDTPAATALPRLGVGSEKLTFSAAAPFVRWSAAYRGDTEDGTTTLGQGGGDFDPDTVATPPPALTQAEFDAPPAGDWVLIVQVFFEGGDAQYLWHLVVE